MSRMARLVCSAAIIGSMATYAEAAPVYTITDLGTPPGTTWSMATGINNSGQVVGYSENANGYQSFLYSNGQMTPITSLGRNDFPVAINNSGQVVSLGQRISYEQPSQVPVTTTVNGVSTTVQATFTPSFINDSGQILGSIANPPGSSSTQDVGIYQNGKFFDITKALGLTSDNTFPMAFNNAGSVLLGALTPSNTYSAFLYKADGTSQFVYLGGTYVALNNVGQAVSSLGEGAGSNPSGSGVLYSNGSYYLLPALLPPSTQSLWQWLTPTAINDEGQIAGFGEINGQTHAFLMTPTPAPEPSTLALLATAIASVSLRKWTRKKALKRGPKRTKGDIPIP